MKKTDHHGKAVNLGRGSHTESEQLAVSAGGQWPKTRTQERFRLVLK